MWLFNNPPLKQFKEKYQFEPTPQWLEHLQKSSVRFNSGGSGSFVSANGLVITNHHVGLDTLQKISSEKNNYVRDGFYAKTQKDEPKATDLELNVLMSIEDVTERVKRRCKPACRREDASKATRERHRRDREREQRENRTALRRRHTLPGRRLQSLSLQTLRRCASGFRAGTADRLLRRRSR